MPAIYAHRVFGEAVINTLSPTLVDPLMDHLPLFQMGLHGPDLLFYYQPFFKTPLGALGNLLHRCTGRQVIETMLEVTRRLPEEDRDAGLAYTLGFACHYLLDSACHPYVEQLVKSGKAPHCTIEGEFDLWLIHGEGKIPTETDPVSHLAELSAADCAVIATYFAALSHLVYPEAPLKERPRKIVSAYRMLMRLSHIFSSRYGALRGFAHAGLFLTGGHEERKGLVYKKAHDPAFEGCCAQLFSLMEGAVWEAPALLSSVARGDLSHRFDHVFVG
ncbi:MAG: zinc dependent phospholipase C family protein [Clostridia bacterium]|nr:zinc dependent phospholipase C family protein [Clostridia bacterium]